MAWWHHHPPKNVQNMNSSLCVDASVTSQIVDYKTHLHAHTLSGVMFQSKGTKGSNVKFQFCRQ